MKPSIFQENIYAAYDETDSNLSLTAVAGSGKSTTLEELAVRTPISKGILLVAFNKDIVSDLTRKLAGHNLGNITVKTLNALGYGIMKNNMQTARLDAQKTDNVFTTIAKDKNQFFKWRNTVSRIVDLLRANLIFLPEPRDILETMEEYSLEPPFKDSDSLVFCKTVIHTFHACINNVLVPDFRDQVFQPIYRGWEIPQYDVVMVDEAQDLDKCQAELVKRSARRLIMVGDPEQAIYRFRGAMNDAVTRLESETLAKRMPLSVCYRCPKSVVALAKKIVPQIEHCDWAPEGKIADITNEKFRIEVQKGDLVLCRCVKPLVEECLALIRLGKTARVRGREIGFQLTTLISKIRDSNRDIPIEEFSSKLDKYYDQQLQQLTALNRDQQLIDLTDRIDTIKVLMEESKSTAELTAKIASIFTDSQDDDVVLLMSIHKAKGLQNPRVFILAPELLPHHRAKKDVDKKVESNLKYVAITRVQFKKGVSDGELFFVPQASKKLPAKVEPVKVDNTISKEDMDSMLQGVEDAHEE